MIKKKKRSHLYVCVNRFVFVNQRKHFDYLLPGPLNHSSYSRSMKLKKQARHRFERGLLLNLYTSSDIQCFRAWYCSCISLIVFLFKSSLEGRKQRSLRNEVGFTTCSFNFPQALLLSNCQGKKKKRKNNPQFPAGISVQVSNFNISERRRQRLMALTDNLSIIGQLQTSCKCYVLSMPVTAIHFRRGTFCFSKFSETCKPSAQTSSSTFSHQGLHGLHMKCDIMIIRLDDLNASVCKSGVTKLWVTAGSRWLMLKANCWLFYKG